MAALWPVNTIIERGWKLEPGQILLTGALGKMVKASGGDRAANFGD
jgi:2-keto-4-pentenoate hydratase